MSTPTPKIDHEAIARSIRGALSSVVVADSDTADAQTKLNDTRAGGLVTRETVLQTLADMAQTGAWSKRDIQIASKLALGTGNSALPKTVATFVSQARAAMHPDVRIWFAHLVAVRDAAWDDEDAARKADKDCDQPLRRAFSRRYQTLTAMCVAMADNTHQFTDDASLVQFARLRDPDLDPEKLFAKIEAAINTLTSINAVAHTSHVDLAIQALSSVDVAKLKAALAPAPASSAVTPEVNEAQPTAPVSSGWDVSEDMTETSPHAAGPDMAEGAVDLADMLLELEAA